MRTGCGGRGWRVRIGPGRLIIPGLPECLFNRRNKASIGRFHGTFHGLQLGGSMMGLRMVTANKKFGIRQKSRSWRMGKGGGILSYGCLKTSNGLQVFVLKIKSRLNGQCRRLLTLESKQEKEQKSNKDRDGKDVK